MRVRHELNMKEIEAEDGGSESWKKDDFDNGQDS